MNDSFWKSIQNAWISVQTKAEKKKTLSFSERLAKKQTESTKKKVPSIFDELFGGDEEHEEF